jgi:hypothetical protein
VEGAAELGRHRVDYCAVGGCYGWSASHHQEYLAMADILDGGSFKRSLPWVGLWFGVVILLVVLGIILASPFSLLKYLQNKMEG